MHRVFVGAEAPKLNALISYEDEAEIKHISRVLRLKPGDEIEVCFSGGREFVATIEVESRSRLELRIVRENLITRELNIKIDLYQGLPKQKKLDNIVQKAVECGVSRIIPVEMERSVAEIKEEKAAAKQQRLSEIAKGAASQSKRSYIPEVEEAKTFKSVLKRLEDYDLVLLCDEEEEARELRTLEDRILASKTMAVIIGPEGGISDEERELLKGIARPVSLGPRILRTETASIVILSQLAYIHSCL